MNLIWVGIFIIAVFLMYILVPQESIRRYSLFGLLSGFGIGVLTLFFMITVFEFWQFRPDFLTFAQIPFFLALTWWPLEIIYAHYMPKSGNEIFAYSLVLFFPLIALAFHYMALVYNLLQYQNWSLLGTFLYSLIVHALLALYLRVGVGKRQNL